MDTGLYVVHDSVAQSIGGGIMLFAHDAPAIRAFSDICSDGSSPLRQHVGDFSLVQVGTIDTVTGVITAFSVPRVVITGAQWLSAQRPEE